MYKVFNNGIDSSMPGNFLRTLQGALGRAKRLASQYPSHTVTIRQQDRTVLILQGRTTVFNTLIQG